ncbi:hypothetical protein [Clostridium sp. JNZ J1-5]
MNNWKEIKIEGVTEINKLVDEFEIWALNKVPYEKVKVKIWENSKRGYIGVPNMQIKNHEDGSIDGITGLGNSPEEALEDTLKCFMELIDDYEKLYQRGLKEDDVEWSSFEDF